MKQNIKVKVEPAYEAESSLSFRMTPQNLASVVAKLNPEQRTMFLDAMVAESVYMTVETRTNWRNSVMYIAGSFEEGG